MKRLILCTLALVFASCVDSKEASVRQVLSTAAGGSQVIGYSNADGAAVIGMAIQARLLGVGGDVAILDLHPPFIHIFESDGRAVASFGEEGGAPGEMERPTVMATSGDSLILVGEADRRMTIFETEGGVRHGPAFIEPLALAAEWVCGDRWLIYGPLFSSDAGSPSWIHEVQIDSAALDARSSFPDPMGVSGIAGGKEYGIAAIDGGAMIRHMLGSEPGVIHWTCDGESKVQDVDPPFNARPPALAAGGRAVISAGDRVDMGLVSIGGRTVIADWIQQSSGGHITELLLLGEGDGRGIAVQGEYILRDASSAGDILIENRTSTTPYLFVVNGDDLARALSPD